MRYRSAAFALKSAHALAGVGSTHFPALGVDADALLSPAAVLYLLRFSGDVVIVTLRVSKACKSPKILCLLCFLQRWRGKCCRTERYSPWLVY